jgi:hypothetical protein
MAAHHSHQQKDGKSYRNVQDRLGHFNADIRDISDWTIRAGDYQILYESEPRETEAVCVLRFSSPLTKSE